MTNDLDTQMDLLERRIEQLESRDAIEALHARFVREVADRRFDGLVDFFADEAVIVMRRHPAKRGAEEIADHFRRMAEVPLEGAGYILSSPVIEVRGDEASGVWTWHRFFSSVQVGDGRTVTAWGVWEEGRYDCKYIRIDGRWLFSEMRFRIVRPDPDPIQPE